MSGAIPLLPLYAFMAWTGKTLLFYLFSNGYEPFEAQIKVWTYSWVFKNPCLGNGRMIF